MWPSSPGIAGTDGKICVTHGVSERCPGWGNWFVSTVAVTQTQTRPLSSYILSWLFGIIALSSPNRSTWKSDDRRDTLKYSFTENALTLTSTNKQLHKSNRSDPVNYQTDFPFTTNWRRLTANLYPRPSWIRAKLSSGYASFLRRSLKFHSVI